MDTNTSVPVASVTHMRFRSEQFLQQAIAGLFMKMPGIHGVQILHSPREFGKDIVFQTKGALGETVHCACVIKNTPINGQASSSRGASAVLTQARQALQKPYLDGRGLEVRIQQVYVVTPAKISQESIESIEEELRSISGQLHFVDGSMLFSLFSTWWPDFVPEEVDAIGRYKAASAVAIGEETLRNLAQIYNLDITNKPARFVYVKQDFFQSFPFLKPHAIQQELSALTIGITWSAQTLNHLLELTALIRHRLRILAEWGFPCGEPQIREVGLEKNNGPRSAKITASALNKNEDKDNLDYLLEIFSAYKNIDRPNELSWRFFEYLVTEFQQTVASSFKDAYDQAGHGPPQHGKNNYKSNVKVQLSRADQLAEIRQRLAKVLRDISRPFEVAVEQYNKTLEADPDSGLTSEIDRVANLSRLSNLYQIEPHLFEKASRVVKYFVSKETVASYSKSLLIVGPPGFGKSSYCRWHVLNDAQKLQSGDSDIVPVYLSMLELARAPISDFASTYLKTAGLSALLPSVNGQRRKRIRLYIDGLDEVADPSVRKTLIGLLQSGLERDEAWQAIVTSRDYIYEPWLSWLQRVSLGEFRDDEFSELVTAWLPPDKPDNALFFAALSRSSALPSIVRVPLLATLVILVFRQTRRLPEDEVKLYDMFLDLLSEGWDLAKQLLRASRYGTQLKHAVLRAIAVQNHTSRIKQCQREDIMRIITAATRLSNAEAKDLLEELLRNSILSKSGSAYEFAHLSFQEFLTAKDFNGDPKQTGIKKATTEFLNGDLWWYQVIRFYIGLSGNPATVLRWFEQETTRLDVKTKNNSRRSVNIYDQLEMLRNDVHRMFPQLR